MLQITDPAARTLKRTLSDCTEVEEPRFRLGIVKGAIKFVVDRQRPGDTAVEHRGEPLIVMDRATSTRLTDRELDYDADCFRLEVR
jgi:hypothetical protein